MMTAIEQDKEFIALKEKYFSDNSRVIHLKKGDILLHEGDFNNRLFLIEKGILVGYKQLTEDKEYETFRASKHMLVGVHSFLAQTHTCYATLRAHCDVKLMYTNSKSIESDSAYTGEFEKYAFPMLIRELSARQKMASKTAKEKEEATARWLKSEKMVTLGQMAAGIAHELNNAVSVLQKQSEWMAETTHQHLINSGSEVIPFFENGKARGQYLSSSSVRNLSKSLKKEYGFEKDTAKKLAKMGEWVTDFPIKQWNEDTLEHNFTFWEIGTAFHDMLAAAQHATHVVQSVKQLGVTNTDQRTECNINDSIYQAMALMRSTLRKVNLEFDKGDIPTVYAHTGELVQVWLNIMKNACEAMLNAGVKKPKLSVSTKCENNQIIIQITDNGPGIPKDLQEKIFQPSFTTKVGGLSFGLGLGLSIVQKLVDSYEGDIILNSEAGKTVFRIIIPVT